MADVRQELALCLVGAFGRRLGDVELFHGALASGNILGLHYRAADGHAQPGKAGLQYVVGGAASQRLDCPLLTHRAGDKNKRALGARLAAYRQGLHAVESRQGVVRQDHVRLPGQRSEEIRPVVHGDQLGTHSLVLEGVSHDPDVGLVIL